MSEISATVILDSISDRGARLITLELVVPRFLLAQFNTHRQFSRNAASSRAVPTAKLIEQVRENPFVPAEFRANQRGMHAGEYLAYQAQIAAQQSWIAAAHDACRRADTLLTWGVHKQWANRLLEPFLWVKVLVSATEWSNFFRLRLHEDAQPEFQALAQAMKTAMEESEPRLKPAGFWHLPYISTQEYHVARAVEDHTLQRWSVGRCARLGLSTPEKDEELYERLLHGSGFGHWSPFEHIAMALSEADMRSGNFMGWGQYRKKFKGECG